jgi:hypothetical protein
MNHWQNDAVRHSNSCSFTSEAFEVMFFEMKANMQCTLHRRLPFTVSIAYVTVTVIPLLHKTTFCLKSTVPRKKIIAVKKLHRCNFFFQVSNPLCVQYKRKCNIKYYNIIPATCFGHIRRAIFRLIFEQEECTIDNAFNLRDLVLQELVKI